MDDVADVSLSVSARDELEALTERQLELIVDQLERRGFDEPICWLCLDSGQDEYLEIATVTAAREGDRAAELRDRDLATEWIQAWNPVWCREEDELLLPLPAGAAGPTAYPALMEDLEGRVLDAARWIALRLAARLNRMPLPLAKTDDFLVFVLSDELSDEIIEELRFVAPPETYALLRERGLIGDPEEL